MITNTSAMGLRNKTNLSKTLAFKKGVSGMSLESMSSVLKSRDQSFVLKNDKVINKNVMINLQTTSPMGQDGDGFGN